MSDEAGWQDIQRTWGRLASSTPAKSGAVIQFLFQETKELRYGQIDHVCSGRVYVKIADGVFLVLKGANSIWSFVPDRYLNQAQGIITAAMNTDAILRLASVEGVKLVVLSASAKGLFGGAAISSGLATLGGGAVAAGGAGMAGGIVVVASAPSLLTAHSLYHVSNALENNSATPTAVAVGGVGGAVGGATIGIYLVSETGVVSGLSAAGISSGLAALGGGSVATGGSGMLGGLAAVSGIAVGMALVGGGLLWAISRRIVQDRLMLRRVQMLDMAVQHGFHILLE